ncbi:hypothetical protein ABGB08_29975 [Acrocarpospora sp. B8E8]
MDEDLLVLLEPRVEGTVAPPATARTRRGTGSTWPIPAIASG